MLKIYYTFLLCLAALEYRLCANVNADECALYTECRRIRECPYMLRNYNSIVNKPYCNLKKRGTFVCCPVPIPSYVQPKDADKRVIKECLSYQAIRPKCDKPLIVGGNKTEPKEFPFMALLSYFDGKVHKWECGGTLISSKFVLTAAHCFYITNNPNNVRLGELDYGTEDDDAKVIDRAIKDTIQHPKYDFFTKFNDIALVELDGGAVEFNEYIMPACLPLVDGRAFDEFLATGWGRLGDAASLSSHLLKVKLDSFDDETCLDKVGRDSITVINTTIQMCAGSFSHERDTCTGDSGGPLFVDHPDYKCMFMILGVTSYSEGGCANVGYPAFYTRVSSYANWIEEMVWR